MSESAAAGELRSAGRLDTAALFAGLHRELMSLLRSLAPEDWGKVATGRWRVRDVVVHLLDGDLRQISFRRDGHPPAAPPFPIEGYADLVRFIDWLNAGFVAAFDRVSPALLIELHAHTGPEVARVFASLDPEGPALFGVAWAGEMESVNWFDTAREYTERWHHQQQIRDAVGASPLDGREWLLPVIDTFMRALPHAWRDVDAPDGTMVAIEITGVAGGNWVLRRDEVAWMLLAGGVSDTACRVRTDADTTWRLFTKGLSAKAARQGVSIEGDARLGAPFFDVRAIMG